MLTGFSGLVIFLIASLVVGATTIATVDRLLSKSKTAVAREASNAVALRLTAIYSLVLGFAFSGVSYNFVEAGAISRDQAATSASIHFALDQISSADVNYSKNLLRDMVTRKAAAGETYFETQSSDLEFVEVINLLSAELSELTVSSDKDVEFIDRAIQSSRDLLDLQFNEIANSSDHANTGFWVIYIVGFVFISATISMHEPGRARVFFACLWFLFVGLVGYLTMEVSRAHDGIISVSSAPFDMLLERMALEK